jgi:rSAM/selenodomain-associated transferase 1
VRVAVVIPTFNEAGSIGRVLDDIPASLATEVLVVDAGSTDGTREIAVGRGARVILEPRRGYGRACLTGLDRATDPDVVVFLDGDYSDRPAEMPRLLEPIRQGEADIVLGSRLQGGLAAGAMPWHQSRNRRWLISWAAWLTDLGPFRRAPRRRAVAAREPTYGGGQLPTAARARLPRGGGAGELPPAHWRLEDQRDGEGDRRRRLVHPRGDRREPAPRGAARERGAAGSMSAPGASRAGGEAPGASRAIVVMAKAPREGHAKTRLNGAVPTGEVVRLSECMLRDTIDLARSVDGVHVAVMCPSEDVAALTAKLPGVEVVGQDGVGLAAALTSAFGRFVEAGFSRVIAIDADSPHLPAAVVDEAFASLDGNDLVVGPTEDGGYYLVGASAAHCGLFDAAPLGTSSACDALCANARARGLSVAVACVWYDVDVAADLHRLEADLRAEPARAPRTAALLASWDRLGGGGPGA